MQAKCGDWIEIGANKIDLFVLQTKTLDLVLEMPIFDKGEWARRYAKTSTRVENREENGIWT